MHITEEKMAAQLKNMHISNNYVGDQVSKLKLFKWEIFPEVQVRSTTENQNHI
jgi:hypothetical protein